MVLHYSLKGKEGAETVKERKIGNEKMERAERRERKGKGRNGRKR